MRATRRTWIGLAAATTLTVAGVGTVWAAPDDSRAALTPTAAAPADSIGGCAGASRTITAAEAGVVVVAEAGGALHASATPNAGWSTVAERPDGREIEVAFVDSTDRIEVRAECDDGAIRPDVREFRGASVPTTVVSPTTAVTPPTTVPAPSVPAGDDDRRRGREVEPGDDRGDDRREDRRDVQPVSAAAAVTRRVDGRDGSVTVALRDGVLTLVAVDVRDGARVDRQEARADRVEVRFRRGGDESRIEVRAQHEALDVRQD
jgi:hypothetical protein